MNAAPLPAAGSSRMTLVHWLICIIAAIGFMFDTYELLVFPLAGPTSLQKLLGVDRGDPAIERWQAIIMYASAVCGGVFGLLGGYLTDRLGRRRVLTWSILLYAVGSAGSGFVTAAWQLLILRCATFIGVCVEFVAAVAWLSELFPDPKRRETVLGLTQAFASLGGLLAAQMNGAIAGAVKNGSMPAWTSIYGGHETWRYTLISGLIPAIPLLFIRPFLPESPVWREKKARGELKRPSLLTLFDGQRRRTTIVTAVLFACGFAVAFGALQLTPRMIMKSLPKADETVASSVQSFQEVGGLAGRIAIALLLMLSIRRGAVLRMFLIPGLIITPLVYYFFAGSLHTDSVEGLKWGVFAAGFFTIAQFSFWGNYLPRMYPTYLRGTGESFAANVGGRMFGTVGNPIAVLVFVPLITAVAPGIADKQYPSRTLAYAAAAVALIFYLIALVTSFWLPEPAAEELPE